LRLIFANSVFIGEPGHVDPLEPFFKPGAEAAKSSKAPARSR
jgi:hypothetical protein